MVAEMNWCEHASTAYIGLVAATGDRSRAFVMERIELKNFQNQVEAVTKLYVKTVK
jgi:hypothetical protein